MSYIFSGRLRARTGGGEAVPIADATVMLYRPREGEEDGFTIREPEEARGREYGLIALARTDERGEFRIDLGERSVFGHRGSTHGYAGEPFVVDVYCRGVDGVTAIDAGIEPVQFSLGTVAPAWEPGDGDVRHARWEYDIPAEQWAQVRSALDAWTIEGRVLQDDSKLPLAGLKVYAYDADPVQDDFLGSAVTDEQGYFRINYPGRLFRRTSLPRAQYERGGPEVYFRVESPDGLVVYDEPRSRGREPDRANVSNFFSTELSIDFVPSTS